MESLGAVERLSCDEAVNLVLQVDQEVVLFVVGSSDAVEEREQWLFVLDALGLALLEVEFECLVHQGFPFQDVCVVLSLNALPLVLQLLPGAIFEFSVQLLEVVRVVAQ